MNCVSSVYGIYVSGQLSRDVIGCFKSNRWLSRDVIGCWFVKLCVYDLTNVIMCVRLNEPTNDTTSQDYSHPDDQTTQTIMFTINRAANCPILARTSHTGYSLSFILKDNSAFALWVVVQFLLNPPYHQIPTDRLIIF